MGVQVPPCLPFYLIRLIFILYEKLLLLAICGVVLINVSGCMVYEPFAGRVYVAPAPVIVVQPYYHYHHHGYWRHR